MCQVSYFDFTKSKRLVTRQSLFTPFTYPYPKTGVIDMKSLRDQYKFKPNTIYTGDCMDVLRAWPDNCVDLTVTSPPYEDCRTYGINFVLRGQAWVDWMMDRIEQMVRVTRGLVVVVCEGKTKNYKYSCSPILLMADLHRAGYNLRKPPLYTRAGIPGSGGPDWLANRYEFCICISPKGRLPWSDNTAMGHPPKYGPGGVPSHRLTNGERVNLAKMRRLRDTGVSQREAARQTGVRFKMSTSGVTNSRLTNGSSTHTQAVYIPPEKANPGNLIECAVGGGKMGSALAHENEAPFPIRIPEFFIRSFCPPKGIVCDPFSGSGTTAAVALQHGRRYVAIDVRKSQAALTKRRVKTVK